MNRDSRIHKYMKIVRDNSTVSFGCCDSCGLRRIGKNIRSEQTLSCSLEGRPGCNSKACFNAMTGDRQDKLAAMDLSIFNFNNNASLFMFFIIPISLCFVFEHETIYYTSVSCV